MTMSEPKTKISKQQREYEKHLQEQLLWMSELSQDISKLLAQLCTGTAKEDVENKLKIYFYLKKRFDALPETEINNQKQTPVD